MKIVQALLGEHGAIYPLLDMIERGAASAGIEVITTQAALLESTLISHARLADVLLRPVIQAHLPASVRNPDGTPAPTDHDIIDAGLKAVLAAQTAGDARLLLLDTLAKTRKHFAKEETIIFRIAEQELTEDVQLRLGSEWASRRGVVCAD
jgi:hypothetical protein